MAKTTLRDEIGDFVGIPNSFIEDGQQTAESRVVFMILRYHVHRQKKRAFPGYETLMRETGLKRQKTAEGLAVLVRTGWLVKHRQFGRATEYELRYPERDSSTGELSEATVVPQADVDSSTGGLSPLINTKTDIPRLVTPVLPPVSKVTAYVLKRGSLASNGNGHPKKSKTPKKSLLPEDFKVRADGPTATYLRTECPRLDLSRVLKIFIDSRRSSGAESCDWEADFRKFCLIYQENQDRNEKRFEQR